MKTARTKRALRDADGPFWIHRRQAPKPLFPFQFWSDFSLISLLALWNNKNWPHSIKMKHIKNCQYKMGLKGCKWSTLNVPNVPGTQTPLSQSVLELDFSLISSLWGNKNWPPSIKIKQIENGQNKMGLKGWKWSTLNVPSTKNPLFHSVLELDFSLFSLFALWGNKNWPPRRSNSTEFFKMLSTKIWILRKLKNGHKLLRKTHYF